MQINMFGVSGEASYIYKNALATDGAVSWDTSLSLGPFSAGYEINFLPNSTPQFGYEVLPVKF
ncbi:hypothetical protein L9G16_17975 [Shewanella sp. A25]|nr:hypothetical protein [Shewanella shenzhenensis]